MKFLTKAWAWIAGAPRGLDHVQIVRIKPGDRVLVTYSGRLNMEAYERVRSFWEKQFPGIQVTVIDSSTKLSVVRLEGGDS